MLLMYGPKPDALLSLDTYNIWNIREHGAAYATAVQSGLEHIGGAGLVSLNRESVSPEVLAYHDLYQLHIGRFQGVGEVSQPLTPSSLSLYLSLSLS